MKISLVLSGNLTDKEFTNEMEKIFATILNNSLGTSMILKSIINYCSIRNIIIDKFLLNMSITICLLEDFFKKTNMVDKQKNNISKRNASSANKIDIYSEKMEKKIMDEMLELSAAIAKELEELSKQLEISK